MLRRIRILSAVTLTLAVIGATTPPAERVITGDGIIAVTLDGHPLRLRADPAAPGMPLLARDLARRLGLRMGKKIGIGFGYAIGPVHITSETDRATVDLGIGPDPQRVGWTTRPFSTVADGSIGPMGFPETVIRFILRDADPADRTVTLPMTRLGFPLTLFGTGWTAAFAEVTVNGQPMRLRFDPYHPRTLATAGAAVRLSQQFGGTIAGEAAATEIFFGVERPVRTLTLDRPFTIGALEIRTLGARTADFGQTDAIPEAGATPTPPDPDEIVVTARPGKRDTAHDVVSLGADALARCSSIVFDRARHRIHLTCHG
ncbi:hypothetical protein [Sphingomonas sp.]|uniref:hypothetical protein n=1 Tax=Sphingomonas sp. TaxID=28214 RepID=UPI0035B44706